METLQNNLEKLIGQFVADDFRTAAVFTKYKIDFLSHLFKKTNIMYIKQFR